MTDYISILLTAAAVLLIGFSIPVLIQVLRTAREMAVTFRLLNQRLPLIMTNLEEITTNINRTSTTVHLQVEEMSLTLRRIQGVIGLFLGVEEVIRSRMGLSLSRTLRTSMAVSKGIRVFVDSLIGGGREGKDGRS